MRRHVVHEGRRDSGVSDPLVFGVGGTQLVTDTSGDYQSESVWDEPGFNAAGGGGFSSVYSAPSYQTPLDLSSRGVPDVAYDAAHGSGVLFVWSSSGQGADLVFTSGGTTAGVAQWAGLVALADERAGHPLGSINPALYAIAADPVIYAQDFHDITAGDNTYHGTSQTVPGYPAAPGWDPASGLGSPRADALVPQLAIESTTLTATPALVQLSGLKLYLFGLNATLTGSGGEPISGQTITFTAAGTSICSAVTNSAGTASCSGALSALAIILANGYTATFAGTASYRSSSATAPLITS